MSKNLDFVKAEFKRLAMKAMDFADKTDRAILPDNMSEPKESAIVGYVNAAHTCASAARMLYVTNYEHLKDEAADEFFQQFEVFVAEVLNNVATSHSHQWSDIEFNSLKETYDSCDLFK